MILDISLWIHSNNPVKAYLAIGIIPLCQGEVRLHIYTYLHVKLSNDGTIFKAWTSDLTLKCFTIVPLSENDKQVLVKRQEKNRVNSENSFYFKYWKQWLIFLENWESIFLFGGMCANKSHLNDKQCKLCKANTYTNVSVSKGQRLEERIEQVVMNTIVFHSTQKNLKIFIIRICYWVVFLWTFCHYRLTASS